MPAQLTMRRRVPFPNTTPTVALSTSTKGQLLDMPLLDARLGSDNASFTTTEAGTLGPDFDLDETLRDDSPAFQTSLFPDDDTDAITDGEVIDKGEICLSDAQFAIRGVYSRGHLVTRSVSTVASVHSVIPYSPTMSTLRVPGGILLRPSTAGTVSSQPKAKKSVSFTNLPAPKHRATAGTAPKARGAAPFKSTFPFLNDPATGGTNTGSRPPARLGFIPHGAFTTLSTPRPHLQPMSRATPPASLGAVGGRTPLRPIVNEASVIVTRSTQHKDGMVKIGKASVAQWVKGVHQHQVVKQSSKSGSGQTHFADDALSAGPAMERVRRIRPGPEGRSLRRRIPSTLTPTVEKQADVVPAPATFTLSTTLPTLRTPGEGPLPLPRGLGLGLRSSDELRLAMGTPIALGHPQTLPAGHRRAKAGVFVLSCRGQMRRASEASTTSETGVRRVSLPCEGALTLATLAAREERLMQEERRAAEGGMSKATKGKWMDKVMRKVKAFAEAWQ